MFIITSGDGWYLGETRHNGDEQETDLTTEFAKARQFPTLEEAVTECKLSGLQYDGYYPEEV